MCTKQTEQTGNVLGGAFCIKLVPFSSTVFLVSSGLVFCSVAFLFSSRITREADSDRSRIQFETMLDHSTSLRFFAWAGLILAYMANNATLTVFPLFGQDSLGFNEVQTGVLLSAKGIISSVLFVVLEG